jgi:citrate lyase beta subunit
VLADDSVQFVPLIETVTGLNNAGAIAAEQGVAALRALSFSAAGTASSRSMQTQSAPLAKALAKRSGRLPGTKSIDCIAVMRSPKFVRTTLVKSFFCQLGFTTPSHAVASKSR